ncbi:ABC transporter substrate binding protein [Undibacterium sp. Di27W]|uniref:ABC transporter substrate binding protein n=1 Tax=Undibacterium sp. Di27W TaxID=3413036 RepID=UPI003BF37038
MNTKEGMKYLMAENHFPSFFHILASIARKKTGWKLGVFHRACYFILVVFSSMCCLPNPAQAQQGMPGLAMLQNQTLHVPTPALAQDLRMGRQYGEHLVFADAAGQVKRQDASNGGSLAVLYPDMGEPYRSIFAKIIEGIESKSRLPVISIPIGAKLDAAELNAQLKRSGVKVVIALGRQGVKLANGLDREIAVVVGGVLNLPENESRSMTGVSLMPDPVLLFSRLKSLLPSVKRVIVVYDPKNNEWLIKLAREAAKQQGLELLAYEARDLASAAHQYEAAFAGADKRDALWLPQDSTTVEEGSILPLVLRESWSRGIPFFSSSFLHAKKGALFALYPNNLELGQSLAQAAHSALSGDSRKSGVSLLREVLVAVNLRTASHIGLNIDYQSQRSFDSIFPEP